MRPLRLLALLLVCSVLLLGVMALEASLFARQTLFNPDYVEALLYRLGVFAEARDYLEALISSAQAGMTLTDQDAARAAMRRVMDAAVVEDYLDAALRRAAGELAARSSSARFYLDLRPLKEAFALEFEAASGSPETRDRFTRRVPDELSLPLRDVLGENAARASAALRLGPAVLATGLAAAAALALALAGWSAGLRLVGLTLILGGLLALLGVITLGPAAVAAIAAFEPSATEVGPALLQHLRAAAVGLARAITVRARAVPIGTALLGIALLIAPALAARARRPSPDPPQPA
jgi:hypothetical protein